VVDLVSPAVLYRGSRSCLTEVRRLRTELEAEHARAVRAIDQRDRLAALLAEHLAADVLDQLEAQWAAYAAQSYEAGRSDAAAEFAALWPAYPPLRPADGLELAELEARRWTVRGEIRTRSTFADPHIADHPGGTDTVR
jgi:hypothetical protein